MYHKLEDRIKEVAGKDDFKEAIKEFSYIRGETGDKYEYVCICGKKLKNANYFIHDKKNIMIQLGERCANKVRGETELKKYDKELENMIKGVLKDMAGYKEETIAEHIRRVKEQYEKLQREREEREKAEREKVEMARARLMEKEREERESRKWDKERMRKDNEKWENTWRQLEDKLRKENEERKKPNITKIS